MIKIIAIVKNDVLMMWFLSPAYRACVFVTINVAFVFVYVVCMFIICCVSCMFLFIVG